MTRVNKGFISFIFQEYRITLLDDLFSSALKFIWLLPSDDQILSVLDPDLDSEKIIHETIEKLTLVKSNSYDPDTLKEVLFCYLRENKLKVKQFMGLMRTCLGGSKVGAVLLYLSLIFLKTGLSKL